MVPFPDKYKEEFMLDCTLSHNVDRGQEKGYYSTVGLKGVTLRHYCGKAL